MQAIKHFLLNIFYTIFQGRPYRPSQYNHPGNVETNKFLENRKKLILKLIIIFGLPLLALIVALFLIRIYHVEGISMDPTFKDGQKILIQKWDKTKDSVTGKEYVPDRFDVVALKPPDGGPQIVKRVIGLPGDRVVISEGAVFVINQSHPEGYLVDKEAPSGVIEFGEQTDGNIDYEINENQVFVLGDNRQHSEDSRLFGPVSIRDIVGKYWDF